MLQFSDTDQRKRPRTPSRTRSRPRLERRKGTTTDSHALSWSSSCSCTRTSLHCPSSDEHNDCVVGAQQQQRQPCSARRRSQRGGTPRGQGTPTDAPFSYTVKTIPPLRTSLASRGVAPRQKRTTPSSAKMRAAQWNALRYCVRASSDCIRVLMTLWGGRGGGAATGVRVGVVSRGGEVE